MDGRPRLGDASQLRRPIDRRVLDHTTSFGSAITRASDDEDASREDTLSPPPLSSPSIESSLGRHSNSLLSPQHQERSPSPFHDEAVFDDEEPEPSVVVRHKLAWRLARLAQQLADGDDVDDVTLSRQIGFMEDTFVRAHTTSEDSPSASPANLESRRIHSKSAHTQDSAEYPFPWQASQLPVSSARNPQPKVDRDEGDDDDDRPPTRKRMTARQGKRLVAEATKLNDELTAVVNSMKARQEESDSIHALLIERAERSSQRITFLQNRISYLESELRENDGELQHLRICLKAVEVQLPPHPDEELQRCIAAFKDDYRELKERRAGRASVGSWGSGELSWVEGSPAM